MDLWFVKLVGIYAVGTLLIILATGRAEGTVIRLGADGHARHHFGKGGSHGDNDHNRRPLGSNPSDTGRGPDLEEIQEAILAAENQQHNNQLYSDMVREQDLEFYRKIVNNDDYRNNIELLAHRKDGSNRPEEMDPVTASRKHKLDKIMMLKSFVELQAMSEEELLDSLVEGVTDFYQERCHRLFQKENVANIEEGSEDYDEDSFYGYESSSSESDEFTKRRNALPRDHHPRHMTFEEHRDNKRRELEAQKQVFPNTDYTGEDSDLYHVSVGDRIFCAPPKTGRRELAHGLYKEKGTRFYYDKATLRRRLPPLNNNISVSLFFLDDSKAWSEQNRKMHSPNEGNYRPDRIYLVREPIDRLTSIYLDFVLTEKQKDYRRALGDTDILTFINDFDKLRGRVNSVNPMTHLCEYDTPAIYEKKSPIIQDMLYREPQFQSDLHHVHKNKNWLLAKAMIFTHLEAFGDYYASDFDLFCYAKRNEAIDNKVLNDPSRKVFDLLDHFDEDHITEVGDEEDMPRMNRHRRKHQHMTNTNIKLDDLDSFDSVWARERSHSGDGSAGSFSDLLLSNSEAWDFDEEEFEEEWQLEDEKERQKHKKGHVRFPEAKRRSRTALRTSDGRIDARRGDMHNLHRELHEEAAKNRLQRGIQLQDEISLDKFLASLSSSSSLSSFFDYDDSEEKEEEDEDSLEREIENEMQQEMEQEKVIDMLDYQHEKAADQQEQDG